MSNFHVKLFVPGSVPFCRTAVCKPYKLFCSYRYVLQYFPKLLINFALAGRLSHHITLIGNAFSSISSWLVVALTIDRLILTRYPFKASVLSTPKRAYIAIALIVFWCFAFNAVWMYEFFEEPIEVGACNGYWRIPNKIVRPDNSTYTPIRYRPAYQVYAIVSAVLTMYVLPAIILITCNILILLTFMSGRFSARNTSANDSSRQTKKKLAEMRLTKMIVVVSIIFLICNMPDIVVRLLWKFVDPLVVGNVQPIAHLFLMVNVAANFIVYALFNRHLFDTILLWTNRYCCCTNREPSEKTHSALPTSSCDSANSKPTSDTA